MGFSRLLPTLSVSLTADSCHRRKIACSGVKPCDRCEQAEINCTYDALPQKKGPKGARAKIITQIRNEQSGILPLVGPTGPFSRTPSLLSPERIRACFDYFYQRIYPVQPVPDLRSTDEIVKHIDRTEEYCMVAAMCARTLMHASTTHFTGIDIPLDSNTTIEGLMKSFQQECSRVRQCLDYLEKPTHLTVLTSWFLHGYFLELGQENTAWSYIREATTQALLLKMHDETNYKDTSLDTRDRRVLCGLLFLADR